MDSPQTNPPPTSKAAGCLTLLGLAVLFFLLGWGLFRFAPVVWSAAKNMDDISRLGVWIVAAAIVHAVCSKPKKGNQ